MASTRSAAQRRRAQAIRASSRPASSAPPERDLEELDDGGDGGAGGYALDGDDGGWSVPRRAWPWVAGMVIVVLGLADATYLTIAHYDSAKILACSDNGIINCGKVTTSQYSHILGIPVAVLGLVFFVGMLPLQTPWAWRSANLYLRSARLLGCVVGVGMIVWLIYAELFLIGSICLYCTGVHILTFLLFAFTLFGTIATSPEPA